MSDPTPTLNPSVPGIDPASRPGLRVSVREFFFAEEVPYGLALCRMALPVILLYVVLRRWVHAREFFSSDGGVAPLADNYGYFNMLPVPSGTMADTILPNAPNIASIPSIKGAAQL